MLQQTLVQDKKRPISLTVRVSGLLILATIAPLLITVIIIYSLSRPVLIRQTSQNMATDAQKHASLIDDYFNQQVQATESLGHLQPIQSFLSGDKSADTKALALQNLAIGRSHGSNSEDWTLLDLQGTPQLYYPLAPMRHGQYYISPTNLQTLQSANQKQGQAPVSLISDVSYDQTVNQAFVDIYSPVFSSNQHLIGIVRATFDLQYIWDIVNGESGANGPGSYALIFDQHGVCIALTDNTTDPFSLTHSPQLFTTITKISSQQQQSMNDNGLYGISGNTTMPVFENGQQLAAIVQSNTSNSTFQITPSGSQGAFQGAKSYAASVHWSYLVLSPLNNVTAVADDQLRIMSFVTLAILVIAAMLGLGVGRRITSPILHAVERLRQSSQELKTLAEKEQGAATQQSWVVESSQVGLQTVQYYAQAANVALQQFSAKGQYLVERWQHITAENARGTVRQLVDNAQYIEKAIQHQTESAKKLESTINVTIQVSEQLSTAAASATEAAEQLEQVVDQLEQVIGK